jgi:hypothetical protein
MMDYDKIKDDADFYSGTDTTTYDIDYYHKVTVTSDADTGIKTIEVKVYWDPAATSSTHNIELETIIAQ